jgi:hypothetical protein
MDYRAGMILAIVEIYELLLPRYFFASKAAPIYSASSVVFLMTPDFPLSV